MLEDIISKLRAMANSPVYALRRGVLLVAAQNLEAMEAEIAGAKEDIRRLMYVPADIVAENKLLRAIAEQARNYILYKQGTAKVVTDNIKKALVKAVGEAVK